MRKLLSVLSSTLQGGVRGGLLFVAFLATTTLWAADFCSGDLCYNITSSSEPYTVVVADANSSITTANIPETVTYDGTTYSVTGIGNYAFQHCSSLASVTIPEGVTGIGMWAFSGCSSLTSITLPNSVSYIGKMAFSWCSALTIINIPSSVKAIESDAFLNTKIYNDKSNWDGLVLYIDDCLISANRYNGSSRTYLSDPIYRIKENTRLIADDAFWSCDKVTEIIIPNSVKIIGSGAFSGCSSLLAISIPEDVTTIGQGSFSGCSSLLAISIPEGVTTIGQGTFAGCYSLEEITFPNSITYLDADCRIENTKWYTNQEDGLLYIGCVLYKYKGEMPANASITIKDGIVRINPKLFYDYSDKIISITLPNSLKSIGRDAFYFCKLEQINYMGDIADWCKIKFENSYAHPMYYYTRFLINNQELVGDLVIPNTVDSIYDYTFQYFENITSVVIPNSVISIGSWAFDRSSLTSITIPNSVTNIGNYAFLSCSSLTTITIGSGVKTIGKSAFENCSSITKVNYTGDIADWCKIQFVDAFASPFQLNKSYNNYYSITKFYLNEQPFDGIFPNNVDRINAYAFARASFDNEHYNSITIGDNVKYIGDGAFSGCTDLERVYLPTTPPKLGKNVFDYGWDGISYFYIPCGLEKIYKESDWKNYTNDDTKFSSYHKIMHSGYCGDSLNLSWSYNAEKLTITGTGEYHPYGCTPWELLIGSIKTLEIGQGITSISDNAFDELVNLNTLILPNSIEEIGAKAFNTCKKLYDIYCYAQFPPETSNNTFVNYNAFLHVPCDYQRYYTADMVFSKFTNVECISAETISTDSIIVSPSFNDVVFTWPTESNAGSYTLTINKDGEVFCTLTFNAAGQLTGIAFAPSRNGQRHAPAATQSANGFTFTVTGLDEGTDYSYNLVIKDNAGKTLQTYSGDFRTQSTNDRTVTVEYDALQGEVIGAGVYQVGDTVTLTAIPNDGYRFVRWSNDVEDNPYTFVISENIMLSAEFTIEQTAVENISSPTTNCQKIIRDRQLYIYHNGSTYNVMGVIVE